MGCERHRALHGVHRSDQFGLRRRDIFGYVECLSRQYCCEAIALPVGMVCRRLSHADVGRLHDPHTTNPVHSEPCGGPRYSADRLHHGAWHLSAVLTGRGTFGNGAVATGVFRLACFHSVELLLAHPTRQNDLHPALRTMAVKGRWIVTTGTSCRGTPLWVAKVSQRQRFLLDDASYL